MLNSQKIQSLSKRKMWRKAISLSLALTVLESLFLLWLCFQIDLIDQNITGLGFEENRWSLIAFFSISTSFLFLMDSCLLNLSGESLKRRSGLSGSQEEKQSYKREALLLASCLGMAFFPLIPYSESGSAFFNDIHVWGTILCFILYQLAWFLPALLSWQKTGSMAWMNGWQKQETVGQLVLLLIGFILICFSHQISGIAEISYAFLEIWFLQLMLQEHKNARSFL